MFVILVSAVSGCWHIIACSFQACGLSQLFLRRKKLQWSLIYCCCYSHGMSFIFPKCKRTLRFSAWEMVWLWPVLWHWKQRQWEKCALVLGLGKWPTLIAECPTPLLHTHVWQEGTVERCQSFSILHATTLGTRSLLGERKGRKMHRATWRVIETSFTYL